MAITYIAKGMTCDHCVVSVREEVSEVEGVTAVDVDLETKLVRVEGEGVAPDRVAAAIDEAGYEPVAA